MKFDKKLHFQIAFLLQLSILSGSVPFPSHREVEPFSRIENPVLIPDLNEQKSTTQSPKITKRLKVNKKNLNLLRKKPSRSKTKNTNLLKRYITTELTTITNPTEPSRNNVSSNEYYEEQNYDDYENYEAGEPDVSTGNDLTSVPILSTTEQLPMSQTEIDVTRSINSSLTDFNIITSPKETTSETTISSTLFLIKSQIYSSTEFPTHFQLKTPEKEVADVTTTTAFDLEASTISQIMLVKPTSPLFLNEEAIQSTKPAMLSSEFEFVTTKSGMTPTLNPEVITEAVTTIGNFNSGLEVFTSTIATRTTNSTPENMLGVTSQLTTDTLSKEVNRPEVNSVTESGILITPNPLSNKDEELRLIEEEMHRTQPHLHDKIFNKSMKQLDKQRTKIAHIKAIGRNIPSMKFPSTTPEVSINFMASQ